MNINNTKLLIIPDVHCREFWKKPVEEVLRDSKAKIVFLGDYLDGYPDEWEDDEYRNRGLENFKDIIELKRNNPNRIELLVGNHDCEYFSGYCREVRMDYENVYEIRKLFRDNMDLFDIAYETHVGEKNFILSHASILEENWVNVHGELFATFPTARKLNNYFHGRSGKSDLFFKALGDYSRSRGGWMNGDVASMIWADIRDTYTEFKDFPATNDYIQIFGHTQLKYAVTFGDKYYCLDCRKAFYLGKDGEVYDYENDTPVKKME